MRYWIMLDTKEKNFVSAVVYVHDAEKTIGTFLHTLDTYLRNAFLKYEIICVDDGSSDQSRRSIETFAKDRGDSIMTILDMGYFQGVELAMNAGMDLAIGDFVYEFDHTYLSYPPALLRDVYDRCVNGSDIVAACPQHSRGKVNPTSNIFYHIYNKAANPQYQLRTETFRILSRRAVNRVRSLNKVAPYRKAVYANCGLKTDALSYTPLDKIPAVTVKEKRTQRDTAVNALIFYTDIAYRSSLYFSVLMILVTVFIALYTCYIFITEQPVQGWTTMMLVLSFGFFGLSCLMTILIKYASLILQTVFVKQKYVVGSIDKLR